MIPTAAKGTAGKVLAKWLGGPLCRGAGLGLLMMLSGCQTDRETTLSRAARQREVDSVQITRDRQLRDLEVLRYDIAESSAAIAENKLRSAELASQLRAVQANLLTELAPLKIAEQDLAAAKARAAAIEQELQPLRALEQTLRDREKLQADLTKRLGAIEGEVAGLEKAVAEKTAALQPRLQAAQKQMAAVEAIAKALAEAMAASQAAAPLLNAAASTPAAGAQTPAK